MKNFTLTKKAKAAIQKGAYAMADADGSSESAIELAVAGIRTSLGKAKKNIPWATMAVIQQEHLTDYVRRAEGRELEWEDGKAVGGAGNSATASWSRARGRCVTDHGYTFADKPKAKTKDAQAKAKARAKAKAEEDKVIDRVLQYADKHDIEPMVAGVELGSKEPKRAVQNMYFTAGQRIIKRQEAEVRTLKSAIRQAVKDTDDADTLRKVLEILEAKTV